jgi:hypothetical protein
VVADIREGRSGSENAQRPDLHGILERGLELCLTLTRSTNLRFLRRELIACLDVALVVHRLAVKETYPSLLSIVRTLTGQRRNQARHGDREAATEPLAAWRLADIPLAMPGMTLGETGPAQNSANTTGGGERRLQPQVAARHVPSQHVVGDVDGR